MTEEPFDSPVSFLKKAERIGKIAALIILVGALALIIYFFILVFSEGTDNRPPHVLPTAAEKIRVERLIKKHGLQYQASVIEIREDKSMWFRRGGQWCQLK